MALHGRTPYPQALHSMTLSDARDFFASKSFGAYRSSLEARQKVTASMLGRFDNVLRGMNVLAKMLGHRRR